MNNKKTILKMWRDSFPSLKNYKTNNLYKVIGPFVVGIELIKLPRVEEYRPHFVIYPLYGNNLGIDLLSCFKYPLVLFEISKENGLQYNIPYNGEDYQHLEAIQSVKNIKIIDLDSNVEINEINKIINEQLKDEMNIIRLAQPNFHKINYYAALYINDKEAMKTVLKEVLEDSKSWNMDYFFKKNGDFNSWYKQLQSTNRNDFMNIVAKNKEDKKLTKILFFELVENDRVI